MATAPHKVVTVYPDGTVEERDATPEEVAQREADHKAFKAQAEAEKKAREEVEAKRASAKAKLAALGLDADEIAAMGL